VLAFGDLMHSDHIKTITPTALSTEVIHQLQQADDIVYQILMQYDLLIKLSQVPIILFPCDFGECGKRAICVRTFITNDFMTGVPAVPDVHIPLQALMDMEARIKAQIEGISRVCFDLTSKPPATTEWE